MFSLQALYLLVLFVFFLHSSNISAISESHPSSHEAAKPNETCTTDADCHHRAFGNHSVCYERHCICTLGFIPSPKTSECIPLNCRTNSTTDCITFFNHTVCIAGHCQCASSYSLDEPSEQCKEKTAKHHFPYAILIGVFIAGSIGVAVVVFYYLKIHKRREGYE